MSRNYIDFTNALAVVRWDQFLIHVKTVRALNGRDEYPGGAPFDPDAFRAIGTGPQRSR